MNYGIKEACFARKIRIDFPGVRASDNVFIRAKDENAVHISDYISISNDRVWDLFIIR